MAKKILKYIISIIVVSTVIILLFSRKNPEEKFYPRDYQGIIESGVIKAVTEYNALSYYIFKGETYGFDYEVLSAFAKEKGDYSPSSNLISSYSLVPNPSSAAASTV